MTRPYDLGPGDEQAPSVDDDWDRDDDEADGWLEYVENLDVSDEVRARFYSMPRCFR